jgi:predicted secreted protein
MAVALLALLVAASGTAVAAVSFTDANGNIRACADNRSGALRALQSTQNCTSKETAVNWVNGLQGSKVADSDKLDGQDSTAFAPANHQHTTRIQPFGGPISNELVAAAPVWRFAGSTTTVALGDEQRITGSAQAPLGVSPTASSELLMYGLCYQSTEPESWVLPFTYDREQNEENPSVTPVSSTRTPFAASETVSGLPAGTYAVGFCVRAAAPDGLSRLSNSGNVNGWVMVTNN